MVFSIRVDGRGAAESRTISFRPMPLAPEKAPLTPTLLLAGIALVGVACGEGGGGGGRGSAASESAPASTPTPTAEEAATAAFRDRVLAIVAEEFPGEAFETSVDPWILRRGDAELHLRNLFAKCEAAGGIDACRADVRQHFASILARLAEEPERAPLSWNEARPRIRPQISPEEYRSEIDLPHEPFGAGLIVAYVVDETDSYRFVGADDFGRWGVTLTELARVALENLESASRDLPVQSTEGSDRLLAIELGDGYDATRLLLPGIRRLAEERLGEQYFAAIPSRDTLILWSRAVSPAFEERVRRQIAETFRGSPYPLTERRFVVGPDGVVPVPE
jgi:uncharacterized protein YtpQ (UPF0354 family)